MGKDRFPDSIYKEFSPSKIITFNNCPMQGILKYVFRIEAEIPVELALGKVLHILFAEFFRIKNGYQSAEKFSAYGVKYWIDIYKETIRLSNNPNIKLEQIGSIKKILTKFYQQNIFFRDLYDEKHQLIQAKSKPLPEVEIRLETDFREIVQGVKLIGVLDRIQPNGNEMEIWDYKTGNYKPRREFLDQDIQMTIYQFLYESKFAKKPSAIKLYLCRDGTQINVRLREKKDYNRLAGNIHDLSNLLKLIILEIKGTAGGWIDDSKIAPRGGIHCGTCYYPDLCREIPDGKDFLGKIDKLLSQRRKKTPSMQSEQLYLF